MYESPIRLLVQQLETSIREQQDKQIFEAIQKFGVDVDRDELIKALAYDRAQYAQGYSDGRADAQRWISVEERLPRYNEDVLVFRPSMAMKIVVTRYNGYYGEDDEEWHEGWEFYGFDNKGRLVITHWMPLPEPPKEDAK